MKRVVMALALLLALASIGGAEEEITRVDLDLGDVSGTIAYSQLTAMLQDPAAYDGMTLRLPGIFNYAQSRQRGVVIVMDVSGCCEASLDFIHAGDLTYPEDFPELYSHVVVTGRFIVDEAEEGDCVLADAFIEVP